MAQRKKKPTPRPPVEVPGAVVRTVDFRDLRGKLLWRAEEKGRRIHTSGEYVKRGETTYVVERAALADSVLHVNLRTPPLYRG